MSHIEQKAIMSDLYQNHFYQIKLDISKSTKFTWI